MSILAWVSAPVWVSTLRMVANVDRPGSMPHTRAAVSFGVSMTVTTNERYVRPSVSLMTVTLVGSDGNGRDSTNGTRPILGRNNRARPPGVSSILNRAFLVNRALWLEVCLDLNLGLEE